MLAVSLDADARFLASGAADGRVTVMPLVPGSGDPWVCEHGTLPVLSVALCPEYGSAASDSHVVCAGGEEGRLMLHRRRLMGSSRSVIHEGEGFVTRICWRTPLIAWANDRGVKIYNVMSGQKVTYIARPTAGPTGGGLATGCCLSWGGDDRLLVGWGAVVKVAAILGQQANGAGATGGAVYAEVRHQFTCAEPVCGLASAGEGSLGVLTADRGGARARLSLCGLSGEVFYAADVPLLRGAFPSHLHLSSAAPHLPMYVVAPRDIVVFQIRDLLEHTVQLLDQGLYEEAIRLADGGG